MERAVKEAMPGVPVALGVAAVNLATRALDAKSGKTKTFTKLNTWGHIAIMGTSLFTLGSGGRRQDIAKAAVIADVVPLSDRFLAPLVEQAVTTRILPAGATQQQLATHELALLAQGKSGKVRYKWDKAQTHLV